jgi:hypothetical protein
MPSTEVKRVLVLCGDRYHPAEMVMEGLRASVGSEFSFAVAPDGPLIELGDKYSAVVIAKLNVDENPQTSANYGITSIPTLNIYKGGQIVKTIVGAKPKAALLADLAPYL